MFFEAELAVRLRILVDEWIQTGRREDGSEAPLDKKLSAIVIAKHAHSNYLAAYSPAVVANSEGLLFLQYADLPKEPPSASEFSAITETAACRLFTYLMASSWKNQLCKCRYQLCGSYFFIKRPRSSYKDGTFCREHQQAMAAVVTTRVKRERACAELITVAAKILLRSPTKYAAWRDSPRKKSMLAINVTDQILLRLWLRKLGCRAPHVNWITRHQDEIETRRVELEVARPLVMTIASS